MQVILTKSDARVYLKSLTLNDVNDTYLNWLNDPEVNKYLEVRFFDKSKHATEEFVKLNNYGDNLKTPHLFGIYLKENNKHIGNIKLGRVIEPHKITDMGLLLGSKEEWNKGYATEAIQLISRYAFRTLKLRIINACAYSCNVPLIRVLSKAGFTIQGIIKDKYLFENGTTDEFIMALKEDDFNE